MNLASCLVRERVRPWAIAVLATVGAASVGAEPAVLRSPSGTVEVSFTTAADGSLLYSVSYAGKRVLADSALGLTLRGTDPLSRGFRVTNVARASRNEKYTLVAGKTK